MTGTLDSLFAFCDAQLGVTENPPHSNHVVLRNGKNLWLDYFGYQPPTSQAAWCALFASACDWENGTPIPPIQFSKGFVGVDAGRAWFSSHGLLGPRPQPGYLAFYNEHVGRVRRITGPSTFKAIEGNEGDGVRLVDRSLNDIVGGFGVRTYSASPPSQEEANMTYFHWSNQLHAVFVDTNGQLRHFWADPGKGWHSETRSSGNSPGATVAAETGFAGQLHFLTPRPDGTMQHDWYDGKNWGSEVVK
jgi:hypothetical protein